MTERHNGRAALLVVLLAGFAILPLLQPSLFASSDGLYHLYRLMEYDTVLKAGVWYPRWAPDFFYGLGMPLFNYYAPLTYYLGEVFHLLGAGFIDALRLLAIVAMAFSGLGAYLYGRTFLSPAASLLVAVGYMYVPYHLVNLYYRGDIAEYVAYTWFPFVLWALTRLIESGRVRYVLAGILCYSALILTHNLSAFIFSGFLFVYAAAGLLRYHLGQAKSGSWRRTWTRLSTLVAMAAGAAALTAFFWLPAIAEKPLVDFDRLLFHYNFREHFPTLGDLLSTDPIHRYGVVFKTADVYGYKLGLWQAVFIIVGVVLLLASWRRSRPAMRIEATASTLVAAGALFLMLPSSIWLWENVPYLSLAQFPWRMLAFLALPSAVLGGVLVEATPGRLRWPAGGLLAALVIVSSASGVSPITSAISESDISPRGSIGFELGYGTVGTAAAAEYLPRSVKERPATSAVALAAVLGEPEAGLAGRTAPAMQVVAVERGAAEVSYRLRAAQPGPFTANVTYFPGWVAFVDGQPAALEIDEPSGLIKVAVPVGEHEVALRFTETRLRKGADLVSALALALLLAALVWDWRRQPWFRLAAPVLSLKRERALELTLFATMLLLLAAAKWTYDAAHQGPAAYRFPLSVNLGDEVLLEGYDLAGDKPALSGGPNLRPGDVLAVSLFWRALESGAAKSYQPFLRLRDVANGTWAYVEAPAVQAAAAAITTALALPVPLGTPPGVYQLEAGFLAGDTKQPLAQRRVQAIPILPTEKNVWLGPVVVGRSAQAGPAALGSASAFPKAVEFEDKLRLLDLALSVGDDRDSGRPGAVLPAEAQPDGRQVRAGEAVQIELLWQAIGQLDDDLTLTARLVSADRMLWSIRDNRPANGGYPTLFWRPAEVVRDQMSLAIPPATPPGHYEVQLEVISRNGPLSILDSNHSPAGPTLRVGGLTVTPAATPADPATVSVLHRQNAQLADGLALLGYSLGRPELQPGDSLKVDLLWRMGSGAPRDAVMQLSLLDKAGSTWASRRGRPVGDAYPTLAWRPGEVLHGQYSLTLQAGAPEGEAELVLELFDAAGGQRLARLAIDRVRVLPRPRNFAAAPERPLVKVFDGKIRLLGFDLAGGAGPLDGEVPRIALGDTLVVTAHWQSLAEMSSNYTVFAQVLNAAGRLVAQHDGWPQGGKSPTTGWLKDEVVSDEHRVAIPADLPAGDYTLIAGLYDAVSGKRLPVEGGGDFVVLTRLRLAAKE